MHSATCIVAIALVAKAIVPLPPEPTADQQAVAEKAVRESFSKGFARATDPKARAELGRKMLRERRDDERTQATAPKARAEMAGKTLPVRQEKEPLAEYWVRLRLAREIAAEAGDFDTVAEALQAANRAFRFDYPRATADLVDWAETAEPSTDFIEAVREAGEAAIDAEAYAVAERLGAAGKRLATRAKDARYEQYLAGLIRRAKRLGALYAALPPDDEARGRFYCLEKGDWVRGLPLLVRAKHKRLAEVAALDIEGSPTVRWHLRIADGWWDLAESESPAHRVRLFARAAEWYGGCLTMLNGPQRARAEQRIREAAAAVDAEDAEHGRYTLYQGDWFVSRPQNSANLFIVSATGKVTNRREGLNPILMPQGCLVREKGGVSMHLGGKGEPDGFAVVPLVIDGGRIRFGTDEPPAFFEKYEPPTAWELTPLWESPPGRGPFGTRKVLPTAGVKWFDRWDEIRPGCSPSGPYVPWHARPGTISR